MMQQSSMASSTSAPMNLGAGVVGPSNAAPAEPPEPKTNKEKYRLMKKRFKLLVYENECYQEELRNLQRKLLKLSRDKNFLLDRLQQYEKLSDSSDDSDASASVAVEKKPPKRRSRPAQRRRAQPQQSQQQQVQPQQQQPQVSLQPPQQQQQQMSMVVGMSQHQPMMSNSVASSSSVVHNLNTKIETTMIATSMCNNTMVSTPYNAPIMHSNGGIDSQQQQFGGSNGHGDGNIGHPAVSQAVVVSIAQQQQQQQNMMATSSSYSNGLDHVIKSEPELKKLKLANSANVFTLNENAPEHEINFLDTNDD